MVEVEIGEKGATFRFKGDQRLLTLKRSVRIPLRNIESISTVLDEEEQNIQLYEGQDERHNPQSQRPRL